MIEFICLFLPPLLLMYIRRRLPDNTLSSKSLKDEIVEYCLTLLFLTFICILLLVFLFQHTGSLTEAFHDYTGFSLHYLCMAAALAALLPLLEWFVRHRVSFHYSIHLKLHPVSWDKLLILYALVLIAINFIRCFDNAFWGDEAFSIKLAKLPLTQMIRETANDVHPPLYYILARLTYFIAGDNGAAYHFLSFLPYLFTMIFALTTLRRDFGRIASCVLITFLSLSTNGVLYSVEVRMYSWSCFFVLMSFYYTYRILKQNRWADWAFFVFFSLCAAYTHYYALVAVAFFYICFLILAAGKHPYLEKIIISGAVTVVAYMPWFIILLKTFLRASESWWLGAIPTLRDCFLFLFDHMWLLPVIAGILLFFILYGFGILKIGILHNPSEKGGRFNYHAQFCLSTPVMPDNSETFFVLFGLASIVGTIAAGMLLSYAIRPFFMVRYLFPTAGVAWTVLGIALSRLKLRHLWCSIIIGAFLCQGIPNYLDRYHTEASLNHDTAAFQEALPMDASDVILTDNDHFVWAIGEYYYPDTPIYLVDKNNPSITDTDKDVWLFLTEELSNAAAASLKESGYSWEYQYTGRLGGASVDFLYVYHIGSAKSTASICRKPPNPFSSINLSTSVPAGMESIYSSPSYL